MSSNFYFLVIKMKITHMLLGLIIGGFFTLMSISSADCQTIYFPENQSFCFDIQKLETDRYKAVISKSQFSSSWTLNCRLTLPNQENFVLPRCQGVFKYQGDNGRIKLRTELLDYRYELIANYDFENGNFSSSNILPWISTNYQPEITALSPSSPRVNERVDVSVRIKNSYMNFLQHGRLKFRVEEYKNGQRISSPAYWYQLSITSYDFSSYEGGEKTFNNLVKFNNKGKFRLHVELEGGGSTAKEITVSSENNNDYYAEWTSISDTSPEINEWVDMNLKIHKGAEILPYQGWIYFSVEERRNGNRVSANSSSYELSCTSYLFSSADEDIVKFNRLVRFFRQGNFRVIARLQNNTNSAYQNFYVSDWGNYGYSSVDHLAIRSFYPSTPESYEWIDISVRALDRYGNIAENYDSKVRFDIQEYRNGYRNSAYSSDYELSASSFYFSPYDHGEKTFSDVVKFKKTGEFRIKIIDEYQNTIHGSKEISVGYPGNTQRYYGNFTEKELRKIRAVADIWNDVIIALEKDYPKLRNDWHWKKRSNTFYSDMEAVLKNSNYQNFKNRNDFYKSFQDRLSYTIRTR